MKTYLTSIFVVILLILTGFYLWQSSGKISRPPKEPARDFKNISYAVEGKETRLMNGVSEVEATPGSASKIVTRYFGNEAFRDLNGDGSSDIAFIITQQSGGSGTFYYVVVALKTANGYTGTNAVLLGDRIAPQPTEIKNGEIIANYAERMPSEPMTTPPSVGVSKYLKIDGGRLVEINSEPKEILCPKESRKAEVCAQIYAPVCALVQIQCIKAPCNPVRETFPSSCEACKNQLVKSYAPGECKK